MKMYWGGYWYVQSCRMVGRESGGGVEGEWRESGGRVEGEWRGSGGRVEGEWRGRMVDMLIVLVHSWVSVVLHVIITCSVEVSCCWRSLTILSILET